jgi:EAL domain-containing protein (putative c-di-GMP-specific phosphodiesterase class I)
MPQQLNRILQTESVVSHFQPILSVKRKNVIGFEALGRGIDPDSGKIVPPDVLFETAEGENRNRLDRLLLRNSLKNFRSATGFNSDALLFLNCDVKVLSHMDDQMEELLDWSRDAGLSPGSHVLEILETEATSVDLLKEFVDRHRKAGYLVALDDVGKGHSNLDRIFLLKPDVIKIDRSIVTNLERHYHQQEVFKSLVQLARRIGALVVAEGVETRDEALNCVECGADMLQGFFFSKPQHVIPTGHGEYLGILAKAITAEYRERRLAKAKARAARNITYQHIADILVKRMEKTRLEEFGTHLTELIDRAPFVEALYILDDAGVQVTDGVVNPQANVRTGGSLFRVPEKGVDHSMKDYFYIQRASKARYISEPYVSLASGRLCVTLSTSFRDSKHDDYILCIDIRAEI